SLSSRFLQSKPKTKKNEEQSPSHSPDSLLCSLCSRLAKESARFVLNQPRGFRSRLVFGRGKRSSEEIARPRYDLTVGSDLVSFLVYRLYFWISGF
ncbi:unnamed protein product, partial [Linum tenue]